MVKWGLRLIAVLALVAPLAACTTPPADNAAAGGDSTEEGSKAAAGGGRLEAIKSKGKLVCGVEGTIPGFKPTCPCS